MTVYRSDSPPTEKTLFVNVFGPPKTGKTSFAFSFPGPFYYQRFDRRSSKVLRDVLHALPDTFIDEEDYITEVDPLNSRASAPLLWAKFERAVQKAIKEGREREAAGEPAGTFIIDGGHRLWDLCQETFLPDKATLAPNQQRSYRLNYALPNEKFTNAILSLEASPLYVVVIHHTRAVYNAEGQETENVRPDGFKRIPYLNTLDVFTLSTRADSVNTPRVRASMAQGANLPSPTTEFYGYVALSAYEPTLEGKTFKNLSFKQLFELIFEERWRGGKLYTVGAA